MRMMKRLIACFGTLNWSQNQYRDWCIEKNQFISEIVTLPNLGPNPTTSKGMSADAGRAWEHSITRGLAFFQRNFDVITFGSEEDAHVWQATMSEYFSRIRERKDPIETQHRSLWKLIKYSVSADLLKTKLPVLISFDEDFDNNVFPVIEPLKTEWYCLQMDPTRARS
jgi:hypothetical protein